MSFMKKLICQGIAEFSGKKEASIKLSMSRTEFLHLLL